MKMNKQSRRKHDYSEAIGWAGLIVYLTFIVGIVYLVVDKF